MCPVVMTSVQKLPLNSSGKTDRRTVSSLPIAKDAPVTSNSMASCSLMPRYKGMWKEFILKPIFNSHHVGTESDYFHTGGNAMLLVRLQALMQQSFAVSIPLTQTLCRSDNARYGSYCGRQGRLSEGYLHRLGSEDRPRPLAGHFSHLPSCK